MKALVYHAPGEYILTEVPTPRPTDAEVLMRVRACGVCKTDLHIHHGHFLSAFPLIPGHEFAGDVAAIGDRVTRVRIGDRITADNQRQCGICDHCRRGEALFCDQLRAQGVNAPGGYAEYVLVHESQVYPLAEQISYLEGASTEPTACAVHGMDVIAPRAGDTVLQFGAGPTGLILAQLLRQGGAASVTVVDMAPAKLDLAARLAGATPVLAQPDDTHLPLLNAEYPEGFDIVIDATGVSRVAESLPRFARHGGKVVFYGVCQEDARIQISPYDVFRRELLILGSFSQVHTFERAVRLINHGIVHVAEMVTHTLPLDAWPEALRLLRDGRDSIKIVMTP